MKLDRGEWSRSAASIGIALVFAGYVYHVRMGAYPNTVKVLLIAGGMFLVAAIALGIKGIIAYFSLRSSQLGTNTVTLSLAVLAILAIVNYAGFRHHKRIDLTAEKLFTLSDQTKKIVGGLKSDVHIVRFDKDSDPAFDELMAEYQNVSPHLKFQNVDPQQRPEVANEYGAKRVKDVVVASGQKKEMLEAGARGNHSEEDVTSAILKVTSDTQKLVCFVTGHGEKSATDEDKAGYALADQGLKKQNYVTRTFNLVTDNGVPSECTVVVVAGPTQSFFPQEADLLAKYMDAGGKALIESDPETDPKLDGVLQAWNINLGKNVVIDISGVGRLLGAGPTIPLVVDFGPSPVTKNLQGGMTFFPLARTVTVADRSKSDPLTIELLKTSPRSFTVPNLEKKEIRYDPKTDMAGPLTLGVSSSRKIGDKSGRMVVIGDSDYATNPMIGMQHNGDLFYNAINWLAEDENLISIRPKSMTNRRVTLTQAQSTALYWIDVVLLPGLVVFAGILIWWKRR
jgi:ABC-type uncharacterized transport system involved in gliding motility auxiliary subunit